MSHIPLFPALYQPVTFTRVWLSLQTCVFVLQFGSIWWFLQRLLVLARPKTLIEKALVVTAIGMECANFPIQWIAFCNIDKSLLLLT